MSQSGNKESSAAETPPEASPGGEEAAAKEDVTTEEHRDSTEAGITKENTEPELNTQPTEENADVQDTKEEEEGGGGGGVMEDESPVKKEEAEKEEAFEVDLSRMKTLYQFRSRPTLPYLLTEYGMEDKGAPPMRQKEKVKKKKKRRSFGDDSGRDREKEKLIEERQLQILDDMEKLRDYYYEEYTSLLQNKVQRQRQEIRQHSRMMENKLAQEEETARQESHRVKQRLERNTFVSNDEFLDGLPKTDLFYITQLQDKLIREGTLKSQTDLNIFWERIQQPEIFYMYFKVPKSDDPNYHDDFNENASSRAASTWKGSSSTVHQRDHSPGPMRVPRDSGGGPRALSRIAESRESSRPGTRLGQHWAITQQFPSQHRESRLLCPGSAMEKRRSSFTGLKQAVVNQKSTYLQELEKRFPKLEMPKLHCFTMNLGPKAPDPEEVRHQNSLREMEKNRKKYTYKLTKMHQLAMANAAAASRILELHDDMDFIINGAPLKDLISDQHFYSGLPPPPAGGVGGGVEGGEGPASSSPLQEREAAPPFTLPSLFEQQEEKDASTIPSHRSSRKSGSSKSRRSRKSTSPRREEELSPLSPQPIPLSLSEVVGNSRIMEAKCMSTLWTNYTKDIPTVES